MKTMKTGKITGVLIFIFLISISGIKAQKDDCPYHQGPSGKMQPKQCIHPGNQPGTANFMNRISDLPDITDTQQKSIDEAHTKHMKKMLNLKNQLEEKQARLNTLSSADKTDATAINGVIDEIGIIQTQMMKEKSAFEQEVRKVLTEEQRLKFDMHRQKGKGYGRGHGHECGNGHGPGDCPYRK